MILGVIKRITLILLALLVVASSSASSVQAAASGRNAKAADPKATAADIDTFFQAGAEAYLIWQYSGRRSQAGDGDSFGSGFGNDPLSFFMEDGTGPGSLCEVLGQKQQEYPDRLVGVNIWSAGNQGDDLLDDNFKYLSQECGIKVIRTFSWAGKEANIRRVLDRAAANNLKVIVVIGDFASGMGGVPKLNDTSVVPWYGGGWQTDVSDGATYAEYFERITAAIAGHPALYTVELVNEAHCFANPAAIGPYRKWADLFTSKLKSKGFDKVTIGQIVGTPRSACESPNYPLPAGVGPAGQSSFQYIQSLPGVTHTTGHHGDAESIAENLAAATMTKDVLKKVFYVGEAAVTGDSKTIDKDKYYLYPFKGVLSNNWDAFYQDLVNQGYQAYCSVPKLTVAAVDNLDQYQRSQLGVGDKAQFTPELKVDYSSTQIPIWRNAGALALEDTQSLEGYWGHRNVTIDDPITKDISSAPLYRLLTLEDQCNYQLKMLKTIKSKCELLTNPDSCSLDLPIQVKSTTFSAKDPEVFTARQLLEKITSSGLSCKELTTSTSEAKLSTSQKSERAIINAALANTPLYLPSAYRLAFLVISGQLQGQADQPPFSFLSPLTKKGADYDEVRIIVFKIPDIGTNRDPADPTSYDDPLQITRDVLTSYTDQQKFAKTVAELKLQDKTEGATAAEAALAGKPLINCGGSNCEDGAIKTLVRFANNRIEDPTLCLPTTTSQEIEKKLEPESVDSIFDDGSTPPSTGRLHNVDGQGDTVTKLEENGAAQQLPATAASGSATSTASPFKFLSEYFFNSSSTGPKSSTIKSILIYPQGYELASVEKTIAGQLLTLKDLAKLEDDPDLKQYFALAETAVNLPKAEVELGKLVFANTECWSKHAGNLAVAAAIDPGCVVTPKATMESKEGGGPSDFGARIMGGRLGYFSRKLQLALLELKSSTYDCISKMKTTEDLLLGRCGSPEPAGDYLNCLNQAKARCLAAAQLTGSDPATADATCAKQARQECGEPAPGSGPGGTASGQCLEVWIDASTAQTYSAQLKSSLPGQQDKTSSFAGWGPYYFGTKKWSDNKADLAQYQHLFGTCGGQACYSYILDQTASKSNNGTSVLNPYLAIAIALNENGGLISSKGYQNKDPNLTADERHFGCDIGGSFYGTSIEDKLNCMINTFNSRRDQDYDDDEALRKYGYANGANNDNLLTIIGYLSGGSYEGKCQ